MMAIALNSQNSLIKALQNCIDVSTNKHNILEDHSYFKEEEYFCGSSYSQPTKYIFRDAQYKIVEAENQEVIVDVEGIEKELQPGRLQPSYVIQCFQNVGPQLLSSKQGVYEEDWDTNLLRYTWSPQESDIYDSCLTALYNYQISVLASINASLPNLKRQVYLEICTQTISEIFIKHNWDISLIKWLHNLLVTYLPASLIILYIEVLNTLITTIPWLVYNLITMNNNGSLSIASNQTHPSNTSHQQPQHLNELNRLIYTILTTTLQKLYSETDFDMFKTQIYHKSYMQPTPTNHSTFDTNSNLEIIHGFSQATENIHKRFIKDCSLLTRRKKFIALVVPPLIYPNFLQSNPDPQNLQNNNIPTNFTTSWLFSQNEFLKRLRFWKTHLLPREWQVQIFKMKPITNSNNSNSNNNNTKSHSNSNNNNKNTIINNENSLDYGVKVLRALKHKVKMLRKDHPDAFILLWGWNFGSLFACYASLEFPVVDIIICFGFPYIDMKEKKSVNLSSDVNDHENTSGNFLHLDEVTCPVIYVIGQIPTNYGLMNLKMVEHLRAELKTPNALVVVGKSNDNLLLTDAQFQLTDSCDASRHRIELPQNIADFFIAQELLPFIYKFLHEHKLTFNPSLLSSGPSKNASSNSLAKKRRNLNANSHITSSTAKRLPIKLNLKRAGTKFPVTFMGQQKKKSLKADASLNNTNLRNVEHNYDKQTLNNRNSSNVIKSNNNSIDNLDINNNSNNNNNNNTNSEAVNHAILQQLFAN